MTKRAVSLVMATLPFVAVAALHLSQHAAWVRMAGTSGAVPAFVVGPTVVALIVLAMAGLVACLKRQTARVTLWFLMGVVLQAAALYVLARWRGAETPYMAMKMIYLAVYPGRDRCRRRTWCRARAGSGPIGPRRLGGRARGAGDRAARGDHSDRCRRRSCLPISMPPAAGRART